MSPETFSLAIIVTAACVYALLERRYPYRAGQKLFRKAFWTDFGWYTIFLSYLMGRVIYDWVIPGLDRASGMPSRLKWVADWPIWVQCAVFLLAHDLFIYWFHRAMHRSKYLWRIHEIHHSAPEVDWVSGSRAHVLETLVIQTVEYAPIVLLGAAPEVALFKGVVDALWGMFIHSNIDVRMGRLQKVFNGPEMHRWHHSMDVHNVNFATKFAIWDWLWGTAYLPAHKPQRYGVEGLGMPANPLLQQLHAFRGFEKPPASQPESPAIDTTRIAA